VKPTRPKIPNKQERGGIDPMVAQGSTGPTVDSIVKPERPMSRAEELAD
jgi:hypothetical protein